MLSEKDKLRIREEEIFRDEVQSDLHAEAQKPNWWKRTLKIFNQPITLWILSAVVATAWTNYLTEQADNRRAARESAALAEKIRQELVLTRLDTALAMGEPLRCVIENMKRVRELIEPLDYSSDWEQISKPVMAALQTKEHFAVLYGLWNNGRPDTRSHPEFRGYSDAALRLQLETLESTSGQTDSNIVTADSTMRSMNQIFIKLDELGEEYDGDGDVRLADLRKEVEALERTKGAFLSYAKAITSIAGDGSKSRLNQILHGARVNLCLEHLRWPE